MDATQTATRAIRGLQRAGTTYTLTRTTVTADTDAPWKVGSTATATTTASGILDDFRAGERDGETIRAHDRRYLVAASGLSFVPEPGDSLSDGGQRFRVVTVQTLRAAAVDAAYYLQVRA